MTTEVKKEEKELTPEEYKRETTKLEKIKKEAETKKLKEINIEEELVKIIDATVGWGHIKEIHTLFKRQTNAFNVFALYSNMKIIEYLKKINSIEAVEPAELEVVESKVEPLLESLIKEIKGLRKDLKT